jgi:phosphoribosylformylglycinamidine cyclo-ligase
MLSPSLPRRRQQQQHYYSYQKAGVNRNQRERAKEAIFSLLYNEKGTFHSNKFIKLPYNRLYFLADDIYVDLEVEGVGSKVLLAQISGKYSTIGIDGVAMAVNDTIRSGASPVLLSDCIHAEKSDEKIIREILLGLSEGAKQSGCILVSGETGDIPGLLQRQKNGLAFDLIVANLGIAKRTQIIRGKGLSEGDAIIGLPSNGIHSNGVTIARKVLLKTWGGVYEQDDIPDGFKRPIIEELLRPTRIYSREINAVNNAIGGSLKAAVHVTGDSYLKLANLFNFNSGIGFELYDFEIPKIFDLIQTSAAEKRGRISDKEMFKTFNMGYGFLLLVAKEAKDKCLDILERQQSRARQIGNVTSNSKKILIRYRGRKIDLS